MQKETGKLKKIIEKGSEIGGGITGATIGLIIAGPIGAIGGAIAGPLIAEVFNKVGKEISERYLGNREEVRVGATFSLALDKLDREIMNGKTLRGDDFYVSQTGLRSKAETILEGTLLKARNEYEEKKIKYYANFLANLNLNESISFEKGNTLLRIIEQLSFRQIVILGYFGHFETLSTKRWMISFARKAELGNYQDFYAELIDLYNKQLLQQGGPGISMSIDSLKLSPLGNELNKLLNIEEIEHIDINIIEDTIKDIEKLKE